MQNDGEDFEELNFKAESKHWFEKLLIYFYWLYYFFCILYAGIIEWLNVPIPEKR